MKKINKLNNKGFAMTGILYMSLLIFLILIVSLLNMFLSRKNVLDKLKDNAISAVTPYPVYYNGMPVYYNPETGAKCTEEEYNNNSDKLGKTGCLKWYTFNDNDSSPTVNMILDHNTTGAVAWNSTGSNTEMKEVKESLENDISTWNNDVKTTARLIEADEIAEITGNTTFDQATTDRTGWFYLDSNNQTQISTSQGSSKYAWLFDYTNGCTSYGCNIEDSNSVGYWTSNVILDTSRIWYIRYSGNLGTEDVSSDVIGVRPVITVSKSSVSYPKYDNGAIVYFNPDTGLECSASEAVTTPGTKTGCMKWYIFNDNSASSTVNMILDHNTSSPIAWNSSGDNTNGMNEVQIQLTTDTSSWVSGLNPRLIKADEVVKIVNNDNWNSSSATTDDWFFLEDNSQETPNLSQGEAKYNWLFNQLLNCDQYGCSNTGGANYSGYWTSTGVVSDSTKAWIISAYGKLVSIDANHTGHSGVRPVITISKSSFNKAYKVYKVTNLTSDGSFEEGKTYSNGTVVDTMASNGSKSLYIKDSSTSTGYWYAYNIVNSVIGDKYYTRVDVYNISGEFAYLLINASNNSNHGFYANEITTGFKKYSYLGEMSVAERYVLQFGSSIAGTFEGYVDSMMVINLTETFGAGNEPDKEWCDENIDYFDGTTLIIK